MGQKLTDRTALTSIAPGDLLHVVDVSDTTDSAEGTSKKITQDNLIPDASTTVKGKVELATSAETITGTDTVRAVTPAGAAAAYQPLDSDLTAFASHPTYITTLNINPLFAPQGFLINGKISVTDTGSGLTVAIKTLAGTDPSATDPVYCRIGDTIRTISAALSVVAADGTNWCNAGSAELATKEVDYFVYLLWSTANSAVNIAFSRYPGGASFDDFSTTETNEKRLQMNTYAGLTGTDYCELIGRFAATLSAGAGYTWSVPTYTAKNLIQRPIYETRWLDIQPAYSGSGSMTFGTVTTNEAKYIVRGKNVSIRYRATGTTGGSASGQLNATLPFGTISGVNLGYGISVVDTTTISGWATIVSGTSTVSCTKYDNSNFGLGASRAILPSIEYPMAN